jgi:hypothetical protein
MTVNECLGLPHCGLAGRLLMRSARMPAPPGPATTLATRSSTSGDQSANTMVSRATRTAHATISPNVATAQAVRLLIDPRSWPRCPASATTIPPTGDADFCHAVVLGVAWTVADVAGRTVPGADDVAEALGMRLQRAPA